MASLYKLPCIFVVENNKWAIGMYHPRATGPSEGDQEPLIYKKGPAFGMPSVLVDGMDVLKVQPWSQHAAPAFAPALWNFSAHNSSPSLKSLKGPPAAPASAL